MLRMSRYLSIYILHFTVKHLQTTMVAHTSLSSSTEGYVMVQTTMLSKPRRASFQLERLLIRLLPGFLSLTILSGLWEKTSVAV